MRRIWVDNKDLTAKYVQIDGESFHHAVKVVRLKLNEEFEVVNGGDSAFKVRMTKIEKRSAILEIIGIRELPVIQRPYINLAVALPKWSVLEFIVEKAVEIGVSSLQPFCSEFSYTRSPKEISLGKWERLNKVIRSATEQCGRGGMMELLPACNFTDLTKKLNQNAKVKGLFAYEGPSALDIQSYMKLYKGSVTDEFWAIVGSEGGFSQSEVVAMEEIGLPPVTLGDQILRVDTACLSVISVIKYELGLMASTKSV